MVEYQRWRLKRGASRRRELLNLDGLVAGDAPPDDVIDFDETTFCKILPHRTILRVGFQAQTEHVWLDTIIPSSTCCPQAEDGTDESA
jgi:hypothetical protein